MQRVLGSHEAVSHGPTVVGIAGLHGNEPAGVRALESVLEGLASPGLGLRRGRFVALAGNLPALEAGVRFVDRDLNRIWTGEEGQDGLEARERRELEALLHELREESTGPVYTVDLHTTSGGGPPFAIFADTLANRAFARALPVPIVLGLDQHLDGTLVDYTDRWGWVNLAFEAGAHTDRRSVGRAEAALWLLLGTAGLLEPDDTRLSRAREALAGEARGFPRAVQVLYRHRITPEAEFRMRPGYKSFQTIRRGEVLATDRDGEIRAVRSGRLLMPLYQEWGSEGFFLARKVRPTWLRVSASLRRRRMERLLLRLPGVSEAPGGTPGRIVVSRMAGRVLRPRLLRALGYHPRKVTRRGTIHSRRSEPSERRGQQVSGAAGHRPRTDRREGGRT